MRMRWFAVLLAMGGLATTFAAPALAAERVALVIGNANYEHVPPLANPPNDAAAISAALGRLGFAVTRLDDAGKADMERGLKGLMSEASGSEIALVFYAGHGIEVDKHNFLVPVDASLANADDVEFDAVSLDLVMRAVGRAAGLGLVILDACRDNPFVAAMRRHGSTRAIGRGLARVEPTGGTFVAYAAKEGTQAADGKGRNSPYTTALLRYLEEPDLEVDMMFRKVRDAVLVSTDGNQEPFTYGSLPSAGVYLTARLEPAPFSESDAKQLDGGSASERRAVEELAVERVFWESIKDSTNPADFEAYLERYPGGAYEGLARNRLKALRRPDTPEAVEAGLGLERSDRRLIQLGLLAAGFAPGPADGLFGPGTRGAIERWQASRGKASTSYLDAESAKLLLASGREREAEERTAAERQRRDRKARKRVEREREPGTVFRDCDDCPEMVVVKLGSFMMGSPRGEWDADERPQHRVTIQRSFAVGVHEVTRGEFARFVAATNHPAGNSCYVRNDNYRAGGRKWVERSGRTWREPGFHQTDWHPVVCVSWDDARAYVDWLSRRTGEHYRLLTESEWEYVARAGTRTARYWGESASGQCRYANGSDASAGCNDGYAGTSPVGEYGKNGFGLHDVLGNVWEWTQDCWHDEYGGAPIDGRAWEREGRGDCNFRVPRGGAWASKPGAIRTAFRNRMPPNMRHSAFGFRVARTKP